MNPELIERTQRFLFASEEEMEEARLPMPVRTRLLRLRDMYAYWLRHPAYADKAIVAQLRLQYKVGFTQAYEDVRLLKICLGNLGQVTRQWCQFLFMQRCEEGFAMARASGDANAFAKVLSALGKFTRLSGVGIKSIGFIDLHIIFLAAKLPQLRFHADIKAMAKIHHLFDP